MSDLVPRNGSSIRPAGGVTLSPTPRSEIATAGQRVQFLEGRVLHPDGLLPACACGNATLRGHGFGIMPRLFSCHEVLEMRVRIEGAA